MSGTESLILCGLEKKIMEYLAAHPDDRFLTSNRLSLALGSNELLILNALKALTKAYLVSERVDSSMSMTTYRAYERPSDSVAIQTPKVVTPTPTVTEKQLPVPSPDEKDARGISEAYWCDEPGCKRWFDTKVGRTNHRRFVHGIHESNITRHRSENSIKIDGQIKKLYPEKSPAEIADILKISYPSVAARINKMHKEGEIKEYLGQRTIQSCPPKANEPARPEVAPVATLEIESISKSNSFNVGQLLKVNSENQVAIVNATLEVIDERGSEYEVTLRRTNRGLGVILNSQMLAQLIDTLKYRVEEINDVSEDAQRDDPDWFQDLMEEQYVCESIIDKIRKDARIPEEKETNEAKE